MKDYMFSSEDEIKKSEINLGNNEKTSGKHNFNQALLLDKALLRHLDNNFIEVKNT